MPNLAQRIEDSGLSILRASRLAEVPVHRLYGAGTLSADEVSRVEAVLKKVATGTIAPRASRSQAVPA
jgi:hypothetical protein